MEYERALFRVYDKSMEGFRSSSVRNGCNLAQKFFLVVAAGCFAALVLLHHQFVNNPGVLFYIIVQKLFRCHDTPGIRHKIAMHSKYCTA